MTNAALLIEMPLWPQLSTSCS